MTAWKVSEASARVKIGDVLIADVNRNHHTGRWSWIVFWDYSDELQDTFYGENSTLVEAIGAATEALGAVITRMNTEWNELQKPIDESTIDPK